ncbi:hypothetical protein [Salinivibrio sp. MA607]|uniref:hypothetical protein n=1 Tax=Salinivibrio sp. MA607 TaxID=1909457 RepID=UPI000988F5AD|nr:hypothetical protein [Salinivibrio sp. MA607]OOF07238.1 hypothetical protein BZG81_00610 [Salinivibrio sp. MA607]
MPENNTRPLDINNRFILPFLPRFISNTLPVFDVVAKIDVARPGVGAADSGDKLGGDDAIGNVL